jgi:hypothetical protein
MHCANGRVGSILTKTKIGGLRRSAIEQDILLADGRTIIVEALKVQMVKPYSAKE